MESILMKIIKGIVFGTIGLLGVVSSAQADLLNSTINADITLAGSDYGGPSNVNGGLEFYTMDVFNGPISVGSGYTNTFSFFRKIHTQYGYLSPNNDLTGTITLVINADSISLKFDGQAQPVELEGSFTNIPPTILTDTETWTANFNNGSGIDQALFHDFTSNSVDFASFYYGYQPGVVTTQTETLTFGPDTNPGNPVPEPSTMLLFGTGLAGIGAICRKRKA